MTTFAKEPSHEEILELLGIDKIVVSEEHKLIMKERPPTLETYSNLSTKIISSSDEILSKKEAFHISKAKLCNLVDRRPARPKSNCEIREEILQKREKMAESNVDLVNWVECGYYVPGDDDDLEDDKKSKTTKKFSKRKKKIERKEYENLKSVITATKTFQKFIQRWVAKQKLFKLRKRKENRKEGILELLSTEKSYIKNLEVAEEVYIIPLKALANKKGGSFKMSDFNKIFQSSFTNIKDLNTIFCKDLEKRVFKKGVYMPFAKVSEEILRISPYLKMYRAYCSNYRNCFEALKDLKVSSSEFLESITQMNIDDRTKKTGLGSYLSLPVTRIPRYRLLLQSILKNTEKGHPDYNGIEKAIAGICGIADYLDEAVQEVKYSAEVVEINEQFIQDQDLIEISQPHRQFIDTCTVFEGIDLYGKENLPRMVIHLFNDIVIFSKQKGNNFQYINHVDFPQCYLKECPDYPNSFKIEGASRHVVMTCDSEEEKNTLIKRISKQVYINKSKDGRKLTKEALTEFSSTPAGIASTLFFHKMTDEDCVEYVKVRPTRMLKYGKSPVIKICSVSRDEKMFLLEDQKKKSQTEILHLQGENIYEFLQGQKTINFKRKPKKDLEGLSFSFCFGSGNISSKGWTGKTLDLIANTKRDFLIWTRALKLILLDQGKSTSQRNRLASKRKIRKDTNIIGNDFYLWGKNTGRMNHVKQSDDLSTPFISRHFLYLNVQSVTCGENCLFVILNDGHVFSYGNNTNGNLGHGNTSQYHNPTLVKTLENRKIVKISVGEGHTLFLEKKGFVWSCGCGENGELGIGKKIKMQSRPCLVARLKEEKIVNIAVGTKHSAALSKTGVAYMFGCGQDGQLGQGRILQECAMPEQLEIKKEKIVEIECGCMHTMLLTRSGCVYVFGDGTDGQLGDGSSGSVGRTNRSYHPKLVKSDSLFKKTRAIACGAFHCGAVTKSGAIYMWGSGMYGQVGIGRKMEKIVFPTCVSSLVEYQCISLKCGTNHSLALVEKRIKADKYKQELYSFGAGTYGRLGQGHLHVEEEADKPTPQRIEIFNNKEMVEIFSNACMSAVVVKHRRVQQKEIKECMNENCQKMFTLTKKKGSCKYCGGVFCPKCLVQKICFNLKLERYKVCEVCYKIITTKNNF